MGYFLEATLSWDHWPAKGCTRVPVQALLAPCFQPVGCEGPSTPHLVHADGELAHTPPPIVLHAILEPMAMHAKWAIQHPQNGPLLPRALSESPLFTTGPCSPHVVGFVVMVPRPLSCLFHPVFNVGIQGPVMAAQVQTQVTVSPCCPPSPSPFVTSVSPLSPMPPRAYRYTL